jgi:hypothetical protein
MKHLPSTVSAQKKGKDDLSFRETPFNERDREEQLIRSSEDHATISTSITEPVLSNHHYLLFLPSSVHEMKVASENRVPSSAASVSPTVSLSVSLSCG